MSRPPLLVPMLRKKARERLEKAARKTSCAKYRDRCRAILWSSEERLSRKITIRAIERTRRNSPISHSQPSIQSKRPSWEINCEALKGP